jgi:phosphatidylglycerophosphate synthase
MLTSRAVVNAISLSRIPIALLFVLFFKPEKTLFFISVALCAAALATDVLDGFIARKLGVASTNARHWDSLGDKAFYVAVIVAFLTNGLLGPVLSWALLLREVSLYITRILYIENIGQIELIRPYTNWHGYFLYATIALGLTEMYGRLCSWPLDLYPFIQMTAVVALAFGVASIHAYLRLPRER